MRDKQQSNFAELEQVITEMEALAQMENEKKKLAMARENDSLDDKILSESSSQSGSKKKADDVWVKRLQDGDGILKKDKTFDLVKHEAGNYSRSDSFSRSSLSKNELYDNSLPKSVTFSPELSENDAKAINHLGPIEISRKQQVAEFYGTSSGYPDTPKFSSDRDNTPTKLKERTSSSFKFVCSDQRDSTTDSRSFYPLNTGRYFLCKGSISTSSGEWSILCFCFDFFASLSA